MDPYRFISLYIGFTSIGIFFGIIGYRILKRDPKDRMNQFLSTFYFLCLGSLIVNLIYVNINNSALQEFLNFLGIFAIYLIMLGLGFLILFTQLLYKPRKMIRSRNQLIVLLFYGSILSIMFLIPDGLIIEIQSDGTQEYPVWNLSFTLFNLIFLSLSASHVLIVSNKVYKRFNSKELAKRFKFFIIGVFIFVFLSFELALINYLNIYFLRQLHTIFQLFIIVGVYFLYYGIGVQRKTIINLDFTVKEKPVFKVKEFT